MQIAYRSSIICFYQCVYVQCVQSCLVSRKKKKKSITNIILLQMSGQAEYDEDLLTLQEEVDIESSPHSGNSMSITRPITPEPSKPTVFRLTPHTMPTLSEPAIINGRAVTDLTTIRVTTNISEVRMRAENMYQRFVTREGHHIYLQRHVVNRIDFEGCIKRKWDKTITVSREFQVRLRVNKDGRIIFHHYHRRGQSKFNSNYPF